MNFEIIANDIVPPIPLLVHVPHSSTFILPDLLKTFSINEAELQRELLHMTDWYTDRLFDGALELGGTLFVNRLSRLVVDPERFPDDSQEVMAAKGMGAVYTNTFYGRALRQSLTAGERNKLLDTYFHPYAQSFSDIVAKMLERHGRCYILDGHSFPSVPLPYELDQRPDRPDICVGTDQFHTSKELTQSIKNLCITHGLVVENNRPFSGAYVPLQYWQSDVRVHSIMIEIRRDLYMDERTGAQTSNFDQVRQLVTAIMKALSSEYGR